MNAGVLRGRWLLALPLLGMLVGALLLAGVPTGTAATSGPVTKLLVFVEENHSLNEMKTQMPYTFGLARKYGYATNYHAVAHPSLPNYLAIAGGSTWGISNDGPPSQHKLAYVSVFGQARAKGLTAKVYEESMPSTCALSDSGTYAVRHNPWTYFTPSAERSGCEQYDVSTAGLAADISSGNLPNAGMVTPNLCNDAHDCSLGTADTAFRGWMQKIFAGPDWASGHLAVVLTADEDDDTQGNTVLTVVIHPSQSRLVVTTALNHYSLCRLFAQVTHTTPLQKAGSAASMASAFKLPV